MSKQPKNKTFTFRLPEAVHKYLTEKANAAHTSVSAALLDVILQNLETEMNELEHVKAFNRASKEAKTDILMQEAELPEPFRHYTRAIRNNIVTKDKDEQYDGYRLDSETVKLLLYKTEPANEEATE